MFPHKKLKHEEGKDNLNSQTEELIIVISLYTRIFPLHLDLYGALSPGQRTSYSRSLQLVQPDWRFCLVSEQRCRPAALRRSTADT